MFGALLQHGLTRPDLSVNEESKIYREEIFGPVVVIVKFKDEAEVVKKVS